jgi:hypothetical protein
MGSGRALRFATRSIGPLDDAGLLQNATHDLTPSEEESEMVTDFEDRIDSYRRALLKVGDYL